MKKCRKCCGKLPDVTCFGLRTARDIARLRLESFIAKVCHGTQAHNLIYRAVGGDMSFRSSAVLIRRTEMATLEVGIGVVQRIDLVGERRAPARPQWRRPRPCEQVSIFVTIVTLFRAGFDSTSKCRVDLSTDTEGERRRYELKWKSVSAPGRRRRHRRRINRHFNRR